MKVFGSLEQASLESVAGDPSGNVVGRIHWDTTALRAKIDDGTDKLALLRNDQKLIIGNNVTANSNVRLHRGATTVLQFVPGGNTTAEGTLSTSLGQISARLENYTDAGKPAFGNAGRVIYVTDLAELQFDDGASWSAVGSGITGYQEIPAGTINGSNVTFGPLTYVPTSDESIEVYVDGVLLRFDEWTKSGSNIVLDVAPVLGQEVYVYYLTGGGVALPSISGIFKVESRTITAPEAAADALTLAFTPAVPSEVVVMVRGGSVLFYTDDFTVTGATLDWSTITGYFASGDKIVITYVY